MLIAHLSATVGRITIGLIGLKPEDVQGPFEALVNMLTKSQDTLVLTSTDSVMRTAPIGSPTTLTFKYLGALHVEFGDKATFLSSVALHLDRKIFECLDTFEEKPGGALATVCQYFEMIAGEMPHSPAPAVH